MESELLKEPWVFPNSKINSPKEEENTMFSAWKENFQDLSGWCMDTFQSHCDFPIGESTPFKLSGTKYEGNGVSTSAQGGLLDSKSGTDDEKWNFIMNIAGEIERTSSSCRTLQPSVQQPSKLKEKHTNAESSMPVSWPQLSRNINTTADTSTWSKGNGTDISTPLQPGYHMGDIDLDDACPTSFDSAENQRETWDVLRTVETTGSDTFDLLSYLCDDELQSPDGSTSTDSTMLPKQRLSTKPTPEPTLPIVKLKLERRNETKRRRTETRSTSVVSSPSTENPAVSTRRSERTRTVTMYKVECKKEKRDKHGTKRCYESDSDDMSTSSYRESREKNNEASRKSRMNKKAKETEIATKAVELERDNRILKMKVEELEKLVTSMRNALLRSALKKEF